MMSQKKAVKHEARNDEKQRRKKNDKIKIRLTNTFTITNVRAKIFATEDLSLKSLRKNAYSNILKILSLSTENFQIKNSDIVHISAKNIDCGYSLEPPRRGGSNEYPQSSTHNLCF